MFTVLAAVQLVQTTTHFLWWEERTGKQRVDIKALQQKNIFGMNDLLANLSLAMIKEVVLVIKSGNRSMELGEKERELRGQASNRQSQTTWFNFPLTSHFLFGSHWARREMWLKLEFPLAWEAEKQEKGGRGGRERERERSHSLHKQNVCWLISIFFTSR